MKGEVYKVGFGCGSFHAYMEISQQNPFVQLTYASKNEKNVLLLCHFPTHLTSFLTGNRPLDMPGCIVCLEHEYWKIFPEENSIQNNSLKRDRNYQQQSIYSYRFKDNSERKLKKKIWFSRAENDSKINLFWCQHFANNLISLLFCRHSHSSGYKKN
jgi:hypothetical protein